MKPRWEIRYLLYGMKIMNLFLILTIGVVISQAIAGTIYEQEALSFLIEIPAVPIPAGKILPAALSLYGSILLVLSVKTTTNGTFFVKTGVELILGICLCYILGFHYTGIILLILADLISYFPDSHHKVLLSVTICIMYLATKPELLLAKWNLIPLNQYLQYYQTDVRVVLHTLIMVMTYMNVLMFLTNTILQVDIQVRENAVVRSLNNKLFLANQQLQEYSKQSEQMAQTRERNRLAREIHDTLGHSLTGIITGLDAAAAIIDVDSGAAKNQLTAISNLARQGMVDVRRSVKALRSDALEQQTLADALDDMVENMQITTGVMIDYQCSLAVMEFDEDEEEVIYRIVQESITNAIRHGQATQIEIKIYTEYNRLIISVRDNGIGCDDIEKGFGLHHMEERIAMLKGSLKYGGEGGFHVEAQIPLRWGKEV